MRGSRWRRENAEVIYGKIVEQSRQPAFFGHFGIADTVDGRFDLIVLHMFLVLYRLQDQGAETKKFAQALFDVMFANMDVALREMGVGDLSVGKKIKKMAQAFYGRVSAYGDAVRSGNRQALFDAISKNVYRDNPQDPEIIGKMSDYVLRQIAHIARQPVPGIVLGVVDFEEIAT